MLSVTSATVGLKLYHSHFPRQVMNDSLVYPLTALDERGCGAQFLTPWQPLSKTATSRNLDPDVLPSVQPRLGCPESEAGHDASLVRVLPILRTNRSLAADRSLVRSDPPRGAFIWARAHPLHHSHHFGHFARNSVVLFASHLHLIMTPTVLRHSAIIHSGHDQRSKEGRERTQRSRTGGRKEKRRGEGERGSLLPSQSVSPPRLR